MKATPLITVIIPCYNQGKFLPQAFESIKNQRYSHWEAIIIDDGSYDETGKIANQLRKENPKLKYLKKENGGLASARNLGLEEATGDFIQFLDADDYLDEKKFEISIQFLEVEKAKGKEIIISDFLMYEDHTKKIKPAYCKLDRKFLNFNSILYEWDETFTIPIHCALFDTNLFEKFRFPEHIRAKEDWIMWISLMKLNPATIFINEPLAFYRIHSKSMTMSKGIFAEHMLALEYLKKILSQEEYLNLLEILLKRYYKISMKFKAELTNIQNTRLFFLWNLFQRSLKKIKSGFQIW